MRLRVARRWAAALFCLPAAGIVAFAQSAPAPTQAAPPAGTAVLHTGTSLVLVDVVAQGKDGHALHGLKREDFLLTEDGAPQTLRAFEEHTADAPRKQEEPLPPQPPGVFTNYTAAPSSGVLNVLLLDTLNTPMKDQAYVLSQLQRFVKNAPAGSQVAIFGLSNRVVLLQGFTSDPAVLRDIVNHKLVPRGSVALSDPSGGSGDSVEPTPPSMTMGMGPGEIAANLSYIEQEQATFQTRIRMEYTLDAFNVLGHYLAAFPGRKNLVWFSATFPLAIVPDITLADPFAVLGDEMEAEYRQTTNLLTRARVAVYPVDAQGLATDSSTDVAHSGAGYTSNPARASSDATNFFMAQAQEQQTMSAIAADTGGQAYFNTNDLSGAVSKALDTGSSFYTLAYSPGHNDAGKEYRAIKVTLAPSVAAMGVKLSYRQGYFADETAHPAKTESAAVKEPGPDRPAYSYAAAAMGRGAPMPTDIVFRVRVLPASTSTENILAPENVANPKVAMTAPYRRFDVDISAPAENFAFKVQNNGNRVGGIQFLAYVYNSQGQLLNLITKSVPLRQTPEEHTKFEDSKVGFHLELSVPARGDYFIRVGVHDLVADRFGAVEVPTSSVIGLPPPVYPVRSAR